MVHIFIKKKKRSVDLPFILNDIHSAQHTLGIVEKLVQEKKKCCFVHRLNDRTWDLVCTVPDTYTYRCLPKLELFKIVCLCMCVYVCVCSGNYFLNYFDAEVWDISIGHRNIGLHPK